MVAWASQVLEGHQEPDLNGLEKVLESSLWLHRADARLISLAGEVAWRRGDELLAISRFTRALALAPTERLALLRMIQIEMAHGTGLSGIQRIDPLLRRWPDQAPAVAKLLQPLASGGAGYDGLVEVLRRGPPWRRILLEALSTSPAGLALTQALAESLLGAGSPLTDQDVVLSVYALLARKEVENAYSLFLAVRAAEPGIADGYVHDVGFRQAGGPLPFQWRVRDIPGVTQSFSSDAPGASGALIRFAAEPVVKIGLEQMVLLGPGRYRLSAETSASQAVLPKGLFFVVQCVEGERSLLKLALPPGSYERRQLEADFSVPDAGCPLQVLRLRTNAIAGSWKNPYSGQIKLHEVRIEKTDLQ